MNYQEQAEKIAKDLNVKLAIISSEFISFFGDTQKRTVFKCKLSRGKKSYIFEFGQNIQAGTKEPTLYDVLSSMQKYDVGDFDDFCGGFGYDNSEASKKTYKAVCKEWEAMDKMFNSEDLELLSEIQ